MSDGKPQLTLGQLRHLDLSITWVTSVIDFPATLPLLKHLNLRGFRSFTSPAQLSGLTRVTHASLPGLRGLGLDRCSGLPELTGLGSRSALQELSVSRTDSLDSLDSRGDLGDLPTLRGLGVSGLPPLTDLGRLEGLTALTKVGVRDCSALQDISALAGTPVTHLTLHWTPGLDSLGVLEACPDLRVLSVARIPELTDFPVPRSLTRLYLSHLLWRDLSLLVGLTPLQYMRMGHLDEVGTPARDESVATAQQVSADERTDTARPTRPHPDRTRDTRGLAIDQR